MVLFLAVCAEVFSEESHRKIEVDAAVVVGTIRSLQGVNCGPAHSRRGVADVSAPYKDLRIDSVRTHDFYGATDIDAWRPGEPWDQIVFPDGDADPEQEESYNFGPSDRLLSAIVGCGAEVYFRLGRSWDAVAAPPKDFDKFAVVCKHIVMHYNAGWANGHRYGIRYWEVWNEPNGPRFWSGTAEAFYRLYATVARVLKEHDPSLKVGTCGKAGGGEGGAYREELIAYCAKHRVPLDFYSWHHYHHSRDPYDLFRIATDVRKILDDNGFEKAESHVTEWNLDLGRSGRANQTSMSAAAFTGAALTYLQDAPVECSHYYRGDAGHPMGLFAQDGSYLKKAYAFKAMGMMLDTPERLEARGGDTYGFAVLAGRSRDGKTVQVLISNYEIQADAIRRRGPDGMFRGLEPRAGHSYADNDGYELVVTNLPWGDAPYVVKRHRLTESMDFALIEDRTGAGDRVAIARDLPAPGLELLVIESRSGDASPIAGYPQPKATGGIFVRSPSHNIYAPRANPANKDSIVK